MSLKIENRMVNVYERTRGSIETDIQSRKDMLYYTLDPSRINCIIYVTSLDAVNCINELSLIHYDFNGLCPILGLRKVDHPLRDYKEAINVSSNHKIWNSYYSIDTMGNLIINVCDTHCNFFISNSETKQLIHSNHSNNDLYLSAIF
ncbi:hypothetical protein U3516DRAFT_839811 [Neocallimastix sp. 'constans']